MEEIYQDSRIISLNSKDSVKLNGNYNSNLFFNMPNIVEKDPDITHIHVTVEDCQIPVAWYLINDTNNILHYIYQNQNFNIVLEKGNYTGSTIITELKNKFLENGITVSIVLSQVTGYLLFKFSNLASSLTFNYILSKNLMIILGFTENITADIGNGYTILAPNPLNLLGIMKLNICSSNLSSISSFSSNSKLSNQILQTINVDLPQWHQLSYLNKSSHYARMKANYLDNIDLQLFDDNAEYVEMNDIDWSITIQLIIFRKLKSKIDRLYLNDLAEPEPEKEPEKKPEKEPEKKPEPEPEPDLTFNSGDDQLDLLFYKK